MKVIASHNGLEAAKHAYELLRNGSSPLDACVAAATLVEDDPNEHTVGYGGVPNEDGIVELDAAVMDGRTHRGAGVAALQNVRHPAQVARLVMERTNRVLLVGAGALQFARANGFAEENLLTDKARRLWLHWKRLRAPIDDWRPPAADEVDNEIRDWFDRYLRYPDGSSKIGDATLPPLRQGLKSPAEGGTVHFAAIDDAGNVACCTSTSGHAFKLPGRVGDSPILGAGLFADNDAGTCGSIGHGEANLQHCSSHAVVELMRTGKHYAGLAPEQAGLEILQRLANHCPAHERDSQGRPAYNVQLFILRPNGQSAGVSLWGPREYAVADAQGTRLVNCASLLH